MSVPADDGPRRGVVRLDRLLANLGYGSRREVGRLVASGRAVLDDAVLRDAERRIPWRDAARLVIDGAPLDPLPGLVLMLHKPTGLTCSREEAGPLVADLLPERWGRRDPPLSPAGRLDKDTSGLLLLTDDGALLHRIISPKSHIAKRYRARLSRPLHGDEAAVFAAGTLMLRGEDKPLLPAQLVATSRTEAVLIIREGRYHQVRRMFAALGNHVEALHRDTVGGLRLPVGLEAGHHRALTPAEITTLFATDEGMADEDEASQTVDDRDAADQDSVQGAAA